MDAVISDPCAHCGAAAPPLTCSQCFAVRYCSPACQRGDHDAHAPRCFYAFGSSGRDSRQYSGGCEECNFDAEKLGGEELREHLLTAPHGERMDWARNILAHNDVMRLQVLLHPSVGITAASADISARGQRTTVLQFCLMRLRQLSGAPPAALDAHVQMWRLLLATLTPEEVCAPFPDHGSGMTTLLHYVCEYVHPFVAEPVVAELLDRGGAHFDEAVGINSVVSEPDPMTPLSYATKYSSAALVQLLLARGADPNAVPRVRRRGSSAAEFTPLHHLADSEVLDARCKARLLKEYGADTELNDAQGRTPLELCVGAPTHSLHAFDALVEVGADTSVLSRVRRAIGGGDDSFYLLHALAATNDVALARRVLSLPSMVVGTLMAARMPRCGFKGCATNGASPLHAAAIYNCGRVTELLLAAGAGADARDASGATPLQRAIAQQSYRAAKALVAGGAVREPATLEAAREAAAAALAALQKAAGAGGGAGRKAGKKAAKPKGGGAVGTAAAALLASDEAVAAGKIAALLQ